MTRIEPLKQPEDYQTYQIVAPPDRLVRAACEQVGCTAWANGWETHLDEAADLGRTQAAYIRTQAGRTFTEHRTAAGITVFRFASRQRCFAEHRTRPATFLVRNGDWRADLGTVRHHTRPADWVEDFAEHQQTIADQIERG